MTLIKVGDPVRVLSNHPYRRTPEGGHRAVVTNVARKYATATYKIGPEAHHERTIEFEIATGLERGSTGTYSTRVQTLEQVELRDRRASAENTLRRIGLQFTASGHRDRLTLEQIEALAEVAKSFTTDPEI